VEHGGHFSFNARLIASKWTVLKRFLTWRAKLTRATEHDSRAGISYDQYVAARGTLDELDLLRSYIRRISAANSVEAQV
jgi:hypothetical protein